MLIILIVSIHHTVMILDTGSRVLMGIECESLAVVARQTVVNRIIPAQGTGKSIQITIQKIGSEQIVSAHGRGVPMMDNKLQIGQWRSLLFESYA